MSEHFISFEDAQTNILACAAFLAEEIDSSGDRDYALQEIVPFYLEKGDVDLAAELADTVADPFRRDRLLIQAAEKCAATDDDEYALQLIEAIEDSSLQNAARERVIFQKSVKGEFEKAFKLADTLSFRDNAFADIALQQALAGDEAGAESTLAKIDFPEGKTAALQNVADFYLQKGDDAKAAELLERAVESALETEFSDGKIRALFHLAGDFISAERNDRAIEIYDLAKTFAEEIDDVIIRDRLLGEAALGFMQAGSLELADRTLDSVGDKTQIASCLLGYSLEFWNKEETNEALETLEEAYAILKSQRDSETRDSRERFSLWTQIAVQFAWFDKWERAIEIAQENRVGAEQTSALSEIAQICAGQNKDELARQALAAVREDENRMFALMSLADVKNGAGETEKAIGFLNEAAALCEAVEQLTVRSSAFTALAWRFCDYGAAARARQISHENLMTIAQIRSGCSRSAALAQLGNLYEQFKLNVNDGEKEILLEMIRRTE